MPSSLDIKIKNIATKIKALLKKIQKNLKVPKIIKIKKYTEKIYNMHTHNSHANKHYNLTTYSNSISTHHYPNNKCSDKQREQQHNHKYTLIT
jgi:hypothetical protein